jgi:hypothetical protein
LGKASTKSKPKGKISQKEGNYGVEDPQEVPEFENLDVEDSGFEFSKEIMNRNPKNQTRTKKDQLRMLVLSLFDWMVNTCLLLKCSKEVAYQSIILLRKFMLLKQIKKEPSLNEKNIKQYALASMLSQSKFESRKMEFLPNLSKIKSRLLGSNVDMAAIINCET